MVSILSFIPRMEPISLIIVNDCGALRLRMLSMNTTSLMKQSSWLKKEY